MTWLVNGIVVAVMVTILLNWIVMAWVIRTKRFGAYREQETIAALRRSADSQDRCTDVMWKMHQAIELDQITHRLEEARIRLETAQRVHTEKRA